MEALDLAQTGMSATEIAQRLEVPRSSIRTWLRGELPRGVKGPPPCGACGGAGHRFGELPLEYAYLLGVYLGDGCISAHRRSVYRLRLTLDASYPGIVEEAEHAVRAVMPASKVGRSPRGSGGYANSRAGSSLELSSYSRRWPCLLPQHGPGRKHERSITLADWQSEIVARDPGRLLRGLIHSDGCRFVNTGTNWRHPRYAFSNRSGDIRRIFVSACDQLGVRWTRAPNTVYVSRKADVALLDRHIGPKR